MDCILTRLREIQPRVVIHGACKGADVLAGQAAHILDIQVEEYPAEWGRYGRAAGPIRNQQMLDEGRPDCLLAFHSDIRKSKGTADKIRRAK